MVDVSGGNEPTSRNTIDRLRAQLLGEPARYTMAELALRAGVTQRQAADFWRAMAFPNVCDDEQLFTDFDVEVLRLSHRLESDGSLDNKTVISLVRAASYSADRLALWQVEALVEYCARTAHLDDVTARLATLDRIQDLHEYMSTLIDYAVKRHLFALLRRTESEYGSMGCEGYTPGRYPLQRSLGFVDMVAYTSTTAELDPNGLSNLIQDFEYTARDVITSRGARIVKNIGDAVFYAADDLHVAADVVCALVETFKENPTILPVRASLVQGFVVSRSGDMYGPPVNLASRLVDTAPRGWICVDQSTAKAIQNSSWADEYVVERMEKAAMHGLGNVERYSLRRASEANKS